MHSLKNDVYVCQIIKYVDFFLPLKPKLCWGLICFEQLRAPNRIGPIIMLAVFWEPQTQKNLLFLKVVSS